MTRSGPGRSWEQLRWADGAIARVIADAFRKEKPSSRREGERRRRSQRAVPGQSPHSRHRSKSARRARYRARAADVFFFFEQIQNANRTGQSQAIGSVTARERHVTRSGPGRSWEQLRWADGAVARVTADASEKKSPSSRREGERRRRSQRAVPGQSPHSRHRSKKRREAAR